MTKKIEYLSHAKRFLQFLIDDMGESDWLKRRESLRHKIELCESQISPSNGPLEFQMFPTPDNDIIWYMFLVDIQGKDLCSDHSFEAHRILPFFASIGERIDEISEVNGVPHIIKKLTSENSNNTDEILFELLVATLYLRNGYNIEFIKETPPIKRPDIKVLTDDGQNFYVECKRVSRKGEYSSIEESTWDSIWKELSKAMLSTNKNYWVDITFKRELSAVSPNKVIGAFKRLHISGCGPAGMKFYSSSFDMVLHRVNQVKLTSHFSQNLVKPLTPQIHDLIFGNVDANEKRSTACLAKKIERYGNQNSVLNIFIDDLKLCAGAQWRCTDTQSTFKRAKHFKSIAGRAAQQIPQEGLGIIHILYETNEGPDIEIKRREKHMSAFNEFSSKNTIGIFLHGVHFYPMTDHFEWAETISEHSITENLQSVIFEKPLLLDFDMQGEAGITGETHWEQDINIKSRVFF